MTPDEPNPNLDPARDWLADPPIESITLIAELMRLKFQALVAAGFTDDQALHLICWEMWPPRLKT